ncbi:DinB family protein [Stackebrandtia albiflava]|uniref:DinB family protein n=1 Tax=Stackebrandtia albiflava TaxID=406432 RepID=A0A562UYT1_9ACTN|nr:DinB family protein [Stackebrandtia albiflava]TWJ10801.1 DinB family protein [Stackebrandtia albiflava]
MNDVVPRLAPLMAQLDISLSMALERMAGMTDDEYRWLPEPDAATVVRGENGRLRPAPVPDDAPRTRSIILLTGHLYGMAKLRAAYTVGECRLTYDDLDWPETAASAAPALTESWAEWRDAVTALRDDELDVVGRCAFPWGLDPTLPVLDIVWWMNRELIHHTAEIAFVRDLYARTA